MLQNQERAGYVCIGIARISESKIDKNVLLDEQFIPSTFNCNSSEVTKAFITRIYGLLQSSGYQLAGKATEAGTGGVAEIADYMKLQIINRAEPLFEHLQNIPSFHPESLYRQLVQLAGELCTFSTKFKRRAISFSAYKHDDLQSTFKLVMQELPELIGGDTSGGPIRIDLSAPQYGIRVGIVHDISLFNHAVFILAVNAQIPVEQIRQIFPAQVKIAPVEQIANLIRNALPGISIHALPVAPRQIRFNAGFTYFELNKQNDLWRQMPQSGGFAIHIPGEFPGLELEFWAIPINNG
jgi:type VI secretion system protein ImpJ